MIWALVFAFVLSIGAAVSYYVRGRAERETICLLVVIWASTVLVNFVTDFNSPYYFYACLDVMGVYWLYQHQRANWQWTVAGLFAIMLFVHIIYWFGITSSSPVFSPRGYQDILAILGYFQIATVVLASVQKWRARRGNVGAVARWALADSLVLIRRLGRGNNESHA